MDYSLLAHTPRAGSHTWHRLVDHLQATARLAAADARAANLTALAEVAGLLHDLGKASPAFQAYLQACAQATAAGTPPPRRGVDHKTAGAVAAATFPPLAFTILGHHGGLPSLVHLKELIAQGRATPQSYIDLPLSSHLPALLDAAARELDARVQTPLDADLLIRLLYACLVDADARDTEAHFDPAAATARAVEVTIEDMAAMLEAAQAQLQATAQPSVVNTVRRAVYEDCVRAAARRARRSPLRSRTRGSMGCNG